MPRSRNIKPSFFTNDRLVECPFETRLLFIGLWTQADREGRLLDRPKKIKMDIFPADNIDIDANLTMLEGHKFIQRYEVAGERYIQINNFVKHQHPHPQEKASEIPPCQLSKNQNVESTAVKSNGKTMLSSGTNHVLTRSNRAELSTSVSIPSETPTPQPPLPKKTETSEAKIKNGGGGGFENLENETGIKLTDAERDRLAEIKTAIGPEFEAAVGWATKTAKANWIAYLAATVAHGRTPWRGGKLKIVPGQSADAAPEKNLFRDGWRDRGLPLPSDAGTSLDAYEAQLRARPDYAAHPQWELGLKEIELGTIAPPPGIQRPNRACKVGHPMQSAEPIRDTIVISQITEIKEITDNPTGGSYE